MPAIQLFGRRTILGGDDLQPSSIFGVFVRVLQLSLLVPVWIHISHSSKRMGGFIEFIWYDPSNSSYCRHTHFFPLLLVCYGAASTIHILIGIVVEQRIYYWSKVGSPTQRQPRSEHIERLLEFKLLPNTIAQMLIFLTGLVALSFSRRYHHCSKVGNDAEDDDIFEANNSFSQYLWGRHVWWTAYLILLLSQIVQIVIRSAFVARLLSLPNARTATRELHPHNHELSEEMWAARCNSFCQFLGSISCHMFGGRDVAFGNYGDVARALADYLETGGVLDLVPSDLAMGFLVLHRIQRKRVLEARQKVQVERNESTYDSVVELDRSPSERRLLSQGSINSEEEGLDITLDHSLTPNELEFQVKKDGSRTFYDTHTRKVLSRRHPLDLEVLREGAHFSRHALAIYTWVLYVYMNPITGLAKILSKSLCGGSKEAQVSQRGYSPPSLNSSDSDEGCNCIMEENGGGILGDNCCDIHKSALILLLDSQESELVYAQLRSSFTEVPYCIILDHKWETVVLAIRGTFSLEDCVTDVLIDPESLEVLGNEHGFQAQGEFGHGGVYACARILHRDLERHGILDRLLLGDNAQYKHYTLRVVGHSLGSATGTLVSHMIRQKFPTLRCLNYSPPGGSFSWGFATGCSDFCTSFVLDCDLVPRLSRESMEFLRNEVLEIIGRVKVPKIEATTRAVSGTGLFSWRVCIDGNLEEDGDELTRMISETLCDRSEVPRDSEYQLQLRQFQDIQQERRSRRGELREVKLFPPGRIVHLLKTGEKHSCLNVLAKCITLCTTNAGADYTPVFANNDDFNEIVVSPTMGTDHFPNRVCLELEKVAASYNLDTTTSPALRDPLIEI